MTRLAVAGSLLIIHAGLAAQTFRSNADVVALQVTVADEHGQPVPDLAREDFQVFEDGVPQEIRLFASDDRPVAVGLVVDNSLSMWNKREAVIAAAESFARSCHAEDEWFTVNFNEHVSFGLPPEQAFTSERDLLREALSRIQARGMTALYDGLAAGLEHVAASRLDGHVLIVVSDGGDNRSRATLDDILRAAGQSSAVIYTIGFLDDDSKGSDRDALKRLAEATGGLAAFPSKIKDIDAVFDRIARDIRHRYTLGYESTNGRRDGMYRKIRVVARDRATHKPLETRARAGYLAAKTPSAAPIR